VLCDCLVEGASGGRYKRVSACSHQSDSSNNTLHHSPNTQHNPRGYWDVEKASGDTPATCPGLTCYFDATHTSSLCVC
jgi:hypothetical protein